MNYKGFVIKIVRNYGLMPWAVVITKQGEIYGQIIAKVKLKKDGMELGKKYIRGRTAAYS